MTNNASLVIVGSQAYTYPTPTVYTAAMVDAVASIEDNFLASYVSLEGELSISGSYYNVIVEGAEVQGSLYYATDAVKENLVNGNIYNFTGYFMAVSGSTTKYFNIVVTGVELVEDNSSNTPEAPEGIITVAEALQLLENGYVGQASVEGYIISIEEVSTQYGNATYIIADAMTETSGLKVFRGKYLNGESFTSEDQITIGGKVVVSGNLTVYAEEYEITNSVIDQYTQPTDGIESIDFNNTEMEFFNLQGMPVNNPSNGIYIMRQGDKTMKVLIRK